MKNDTTSNQIFIGCPWKNVRNKYVKLIESFKKKYPLSFIIIGRSQDQKASDLLEIIKEKLNSSSAAIFDATGGNANVSLEYGIAETNEMPRAIYKNQRKRISSLGSDSAIISDLAGKKRNEYKTFRKLRSLLESFTKNHSYSIIYERFLNRNCKRLAKGKKRRYRALTLKIIHHLDDKDSVRRTDIVQDLVALGYKDSEVEEWIRKLQKSNLINCSAGRYSSVTIR
ncbi:hypothetical protein ACFL37_02215 [Candidatus Margulisiibacteriota bacterium]